MEHKQLKILVTNDDGIDSPGIHVLAKHMKKLGEVIVIAPDRQQSAVGHSLTVAKPLRATKFHREGEMFGYAINGTPSDCVKLAVNTLLDNKPDLLVSGINHGQNTSINVLYSGTVSAATEGMLLGIPSIAFSFDSYSLKDDCEVAGYYAYLIAKHWSNNPIGGDTFLNVNIPNLNYDDIRGVKITEISNNIWKDRFEMRIDPFGRPYYWFAGELEQIDSRENTDYIAVLNGYVSVTPIRYSFTNLEAIEQIRHYEELMKRTLF